MTPDAGRTVRAARSRSAGAVPGGPLGAPLPGAADRLPGRGQLSSAGKAKSRTYRGRASGGASSARWLYFISRAT